MLFFFESILSRSIRSTKTFIQRIVSKCIKRTAIELPIGSSTVTENTTIIGYLSKYIIENDLAILVEMHRESFFTNMLISIKISSKNKIPNKLSVIVKRNRKLGLATAKFNPIKSATTRNIRDEIVNNFALFFNSLQLNARKISYIEKTSKQKARIKKANV